MVAWLIYFGKPMVNNFQKTKCCGGSLQTSKLSWIDLVTDIMNHPFNNKILQYVGDTAVIMKLALYRSQQLVERSSELVLCQNPSIVSGQAPMREKF